MDEKKLRFRQLFVDLCIEHKLFLYLPAIETDQFKAEVTDLAERIFTEEN